LFFLSSFLSPQVVDGTLKYIDQSPIRAAEKGRVLILEGIEKAERNVLPTLNNLLENREVRLDVSCCQTSSFFSTSSSFVLSVFILSLSFHFCGFFPSPFFSLFPSFTFSPSFSLVLGRSFLDELRSLQSAAERRPHKREVASQQAGFRSPGFSCYCFRVAHPTLHWSALFLHIFFIVIPFAVVCLVVLCCVVLVWFEPLSLSDCSSPSAPFVVRLFVGSSASLSFSSSRHRPSLLQLQG
jgi:hypothetical protein